MENQDLLQAIRQIVQEETQPIHQRLENIEMRLENLEEDSKVTRNSVNLLLDWAEQVSDVLKVPLLKKAE